MAEELKPCPWCGREATLCKKKFHVLNGTTRYRWRVIHICRNGNYAETKLCGTKTEAIATWNRRADDERAV